MAHLPLKADSGGQGSVGIIRDRCLFVAESLIGPEADYQSSHHSSVDRARERSNYTSYYRTYWSLPVLDNLIT